MLDKYYGATSLEQEPDTPAYQMGKRMTYSAYVFIWLAPYLAIIGALSLFGAFVVMALRAVHGPVPVQYALMALLAVGILVGWWLVGWHGRRRVRIEVAQRHRIYRQFIAAVERHNERYPDARIMFVSSEEIQEEINDSRQDTPPPPPDFSATDEDDTRDTGGV